MNGITAKVQGKNLVVTLPLSEPTPTSSGKNLMVASTRGAFRSEAKVAGREITLSVNAWIKPS